MDATLQKSKVIGCKVIAKFFIKKDPKKGLQLMSRTLGKLSFISRKYYGPLTPQGEEFWLCTISEEIHPNTNKGCFLLEPIEKIHESDTTRLISGMYDTFYEDGIQYVYPHEKGNWVLPADYKRALNAENDTKETGKIYATIVDLRDGNNHGNES